MCRTVSRLILSQKLKPGTCEHPAPRAKKTARRTPEGFRRAGLLVNKPPGTAGLPFV
jgi:hypothetical protein